MDEKECIDLVINNNAILVADSLESIERLHLLTDKPFVSFTVGECLQGKNKHLRQQYVFWHVDGLLSVLACGNEIIGEFQNKHKFS